MIRPFISCMIVGAVAGWGCASITPPDGGARDTTAPQLVSTQPIDGATEVSRNSIVLVYDEPVTIDDFTKQVLLTPTPKGGTPQLIAHDEELVIKFNQPLAENTTYTIDFGESIVDVTEKNKAARLKLSFSTGTYLDSGNVSGRVEGLTSKAVQRKVMVGLYLGDKATGDSLNNRPLPDYKTYTDQNGKYTLDHVKPGSYRILAIDDKNSNSQYDDGEAIAYKSQPVVASSSDTSVVLRLGRLDGRPPFIIKRQESRGRILLQWNEGLKSVEAQDLGGNAELTLKKVGQDGKQIVLFGKRDQKARIRLVAADSIGNTIADTVKTEFGASVVNKAPSAKPLVPATTFRDRGGRTEIRLVYPSRLELVKPQLGNIVAMPVKQDTLAAKKAEPKAIQPLTPLPLQVGENAVLDSSRSVIILTVPSKAPQLTAKQVAIELDSTAIRSGTGDRLSWQALPVTRPAVSDNSGDITVTVNASPKPYRLELVQENGAVVKTSDWQVASSPQVVRWTDVPAGTYRLRALLDDNADGKWQGQDPKLRIEPEPVEVYRDNITVRPNWEQEVSFRF